jgi:hypothetical protein
MAVCLVHNAFFLLLTMAVVGGSHGWMTPPMMPASSSSSSSSWVASATPTRLMRKTSSSSALRYQNGDEMTMPTQYASSHPSSTTTRIGATTTSSSYTEITDDYDYVDELDFDPRLRDALRSARHADRLYGLCTPESVAAWAAVDSMFGVSPAGKEVEDCVRRALGDEKSIWSDFEVRA